MFLSSVLLLVALSGARGDLEAALAARRAAQPAVARVPWSVEAANEYVRRQEPVVLTDAARELGWAAVDAWTPEWLGTAEGARVLEAYEHESLAVPRGEALFFSVYADFELAALPELAASWRRPASLVPLSMAAFWERARADRYVFIKGVLSNFSPSMAGMVLPDPFLVGPLGDGLEAGNELPPRDNDVWMGAAGVQSAPHYDFQHNFYAQLHGRKQFELLAPRFVEETGLFPFLHPRHRQMQRPLNTSSEAALALLRPGDVLYIPPMWLHGATSVTESVSFSSCSPSPHEVAVEEVHMAPIPIDEDWAEAWTADEVARWLRAYVGLVAERALGLDGPAAMAALFEQRYQGLGLGQSCPVPSPPPPPPSPSLGATAAADRVAELLRPLDSATRRIVVFDLIEAWASYFLGAPSVPEFLVPCASAQDAEL